jgi:CheY-like chemotaxis protein
VRTLVSPRPGREHALQRFRASRGPEPTVPMACAPVHTVLLVADNLEVAADLRDVIEGHGHGFAHARTGTEALDWLRGEPGRPALILIDWTMAAGDGARFLSRQASDPRLSFIPVIVLAEIAQMRSIPTLCVSATLAKPVRPRTLLEVIGVLRGHAIAASDQAQPTAADRTAQLRVAGARPTPRPAPAVQRVNTEELTVPLALVDEIVHDDRTVRTVRADSGGHRR